MRTLYDKMEHGGLHKMEHGGKHEGLIDYTDYNADGSTALNPDTVDFLTQEMNSEEKELFMDMYSQGLIDYRNIKNLLRQEKPMSASNFRENVLKDPEGPATQANLTNEYGKLFGSGMKEKRVRNAPLSGKQTRGRQVKVNIYHPQASRMDKDDILIPSGEKAEDIDRIEPRKATTIPTERPSQDLTMRMREVPERAEQIVEEVEEQEVIETLSPEMPPSPMKFDIQGRSDRTGFGDSSDVPTQTDQGLYGFPTGNNPLGGGFRVLKDDETREGGGKLYKRGGLAMLAERARKADMGMKYNSAKYGRRYGQGGRMSNQELAKLLSKYNVR